MVDPKWESQLDPVMASAVPFLCHSLSGNILDKLLSKKCLTSSQHGEIDRLRQSRGEKHAARELFQILRRRPAPSFDTFCGVLREVEGGEDLLKCLTQSQPMDHGSMAEIISTNSGTSSRASLSEPHPQRSGSLAKKHRWDPYHVDSKKGVQSDSGSTARDKGRRLVTSQQKPRLSANDAAQGTLQVPTINDEGEDEVVWLFVDESLKEHYHINEKCVCPMLKRAAMLGESQQVEERFRVEVFIVPNLQFAKEKWAPGARSIMVAPEKCLMRIILPQSSPEIFKRQKRSLLGGLSGIMGVSFEQIFIQHGCCILTLQISGIALINFLSSLEDIARFTFLTDFDCLAEAQIGNLKPFSLARLFIEKSQRHEVASLKVHKMLKSLNSPSMQFQRDRTTLLEEGLDGDSNTVSNLSNQLSSILNHACLLEAKVKENYLQQKINSVQSIKTDSLLKSLHENQTTVVRTLKTAKALALKLKAKISLVTAREKSRPYSHEEMLTGVNYESTKEIPVDDFRRFLVAWQRLDHQQIESILKSGDYTPAFTLAVNAGRTIFIYNPPEQLQDKLQVLSKSLRWTVPPQPSDTQAWKNAFIKRRRKEFALIAGEEHKKSGVMTGSEMFVYLNNFHLADTASVTVLSKKKKIHILLTATSAKSSDFYEVLDKHFFTFDTTFNDRPGRLRLGRTTQKLLNGPSASGKDVGFSLECELDGDSAKGLVFYVSSKELPDCYLMWSSKLASFVFQKPRWQAEKKATFRFKFYQTSDARIEMEWLGQKPKFVAYSDSTRLIGFDRRADRKICRTAFTIGIANDVTEYEEEETEWLRSSLKRTSGRIIRRVDVPLPFTTSLTRKSRLLQMEEERQARKSLFVKNKSIHEIKKAEIEIKRKITTGRAKVYYASGVITEVTEIAVGRPISGGLLLTPYGKDGGKITYRLTGVAPSPPVIHYKGYGLEKLWTSASDVLKRTENDPSVKATEIWFHLGSLEIRNLPPDDEARDYFTVSIAQEKLTSKPRIAWPSRFENGIDKEMFTKLAAYLAKKANLVQSFVRHDMQFYTPSGSERRFRIWEPMSASYLLRGKNVLGQYTGNETVIGSGVTKAGRGLLFTRLSNQMRGEILMPDLPFDCRLLIQTDSLTHQTPEDEFETEELGWVLAEVDGMDLRLPELPDDYMLHYQRTSKRDCYTLENCTIVLAEESEILNVQQKEETKPKYDVRVHNSELDEILTSKSLVTSPPPDDKLANLLHETFKFVAKIGILSVS